tara:strand:+ start:651 stop:2702 length:2052 start_codon:yes stop_codon:yes gene_type:complete
MNSFWTHIPKEYCTHVEKFTNTKEFQEIGTFFSINERYTNATRGTIQYKEFWSEEKRKCLEGFTNSAGIYITGQHYFYLNFVRILREVGGKKIKEFPKFTDIDYIYFHLINYCRVNKIGGLLTSKGRRQGYSFKAGGVATHEFSFYKDSTSLIGAFETKYSKTTMDMVIDNCRFLDLHTEFGWPRNPDTPEYICAKYPVTIDNRQLWKGPNSKVHMLTFMNNPGAAAGKSADWLILDEVGLMPNVIETHGLSEPVIKDGNRYTGCALMFGSSDTMGFGSIALKQMFTDPKQYNMLDFPNPQAPDNENSRIGFFSPAYMARWGICLDKKSKWYKQPMIDEDGNSNIEAAIDDLLWERDIKKKGSNPKAFKDIVSQYPIFWEEAFRVVTDSILPTYLAEERLADLETTPSLNKGRSIKLVYKDGIMEFKDNEIKALENFPLKSSDIDREGSVEIFEFPYCERPNWGEYIGGIDPYDDDKGDSLGSIFIMNRLTGRIVAEYTGRPATAKEFYEICSRLQIFYNAVALYENNKKGIFSYYEQHNLAHLLADNPRSLKDAQIVKTFHTSGNQAKGYTQNSETIIYGLGLIKTYMLQRITEDSNLTMTHLIPSKGLLREIVSWHPDLNVDRLRALAGLLILKEDMYKILVNSYTKDRDPEIHPFLKNFLNNSPTTNNSYKGINQFFNNK